MFNLSFFKVRMLGRKLHRLRFQYTQYQQGYLYCLECGYMHPDDAGLDEGDVCPDCGQGLLVKM